MTAEPTTMTGRRTARAANATHRVARFGFRRLREECVVGRWVALLNISLDLVMSIYYPFRLYLTVLDGIIANIVPPSSF